MTDYGKGAVLGAATVLPSTSAAALFLADRLNPWVITAFLAVNAVWFVMLVAQISRYFVNRKV